MSEDFKHFGVKGMKWGVRNDDDLVGFSAGNSTQDAKAVRAYSADVKRIQKELKKNGYGELDSALLKAKYETPDGEEPTKGLSKNQKIAIGVGIGVVAAAALGYAAYKGGAFDKDSPIAKTVDKFDYDTLKKRFDAAPQAGSLWDTRNKAYGDVADGLKINWDNEVKLSSGSVLKRVSSVAESKIREGGFFAAYRDEDVKSYSAILPSFWGQWRVGVPMDGGFINHYQAGGEVKAPSGKQTMDIFKKLLSSDDSFRQGVGIPKLSDLSDDDLGGIFKAYSLSWVDNSSDLTQKFFGALKESGYNAVIDFNDAGTLGKTPLRVIDSSIFSIVKNEVLSFDDMVKAAAEWVPSLVHYFTEGAHMSDGVDNYLSGLQIEVGDDLKHFGVKGMKWGVRRGSDGVRPIAKALNDSKFGRAAQNNVDRYNKKKYGTDKVTKKDQAKSDKYFKERGKEARAKKAAAEGPRSKTDYYLTGRMGAKEAFKNPEARHQRERAGQARTVAIIAGVGALGASRLGRGGSLAALVLAGTAVASGINSQIGAYKAIGLEQEARAK